MTERPSSSLSNHSLQLGNRSKQEKQLDRLARLFTDDNKDKIKRKKTMCSCLFSWK